MEKRSGRHDSAMQDPRPDTPKPGNPGPDDYATGVAHLLDRKIGLSRLALFWERLWPLVLPPAALIGGFVALGLFGLWQDVPPILHLCALVLASLAIALSLIPFAKLRWPTRVEGLSRLDAQSGLSHRPAQGFDDRLSGNPDDVQKAVWQAHRNRLHDQVRATPVTAPHPRLWERDPYALRAMVILGLVVGFAYSGPDWWERISSTVTPGAIAQSQPARLDGWVTPPEYTAKPPIFIADGDRTLAEIEPPEAAIAVPENSVLTLRLHNGAEVALDLAMVDGTDIAFDAPQTETTDNAAKRQKNQEDARPGTPVTRDFRHEFKTDSRLTLTANGRVSKWQFQLVRDHPPIISLPENTGLTGDEALKVVYAVKDDYGVVGAKAAFRVIESDDPPQLGEDVPSDADRKRLRLEVAAPDFDLLLPGNRVRDVTRTAYKDLTAHPWAGLDVEMVLHATDEAGQTGKSQPRRLVLPQRQFREPLARAVIEQRRNLVAMSWRRDRVAKALDALTLAPERFIKDTGVFLGLRTAHYRASDISNNAELSEVVDLLWDVALHIEDGDLSLAERELRAAQDALERALAEGAPPEEIDRLVAEMREALNRFMAAMREDAIREAARQPQQPLDPNQQAVQSQDIDKMMDMIEQLSKSGANEAAQKLLEQLRNLLENLDGARATAQMSPEQNQMSDTLDELSRMLAEQQKLMDETFRQNGSDGLRGQQGQQSQQGKGHSQQGQSGQGQSGQGRSLTERQEALRQQLQQLMDRMANGGLEVPGSLPRAGDDMGTAQNRLSDGAPGEALGPQGTAVDRLREGARAMAQQLMDGLAQQQGQNQKGQTRANGRTDPLGRPQRMTGPDFGLSVEIPDEIDAETARELREELQRRLGDRTRRLLERDYLERLLRRF